MQRALHRASPRGATQTSLLPDTGWHHLGIGAVQRPSEVRESHGPPLPQPLCQQRGKTSASERVSSNLPRSQRSDTLPFHLHPLQTIGLLKVDSSGWPHAYWMDQAGLSSFRDESTRGCCSSEETSWHRDWLWPQGGQEIRSTKGTPDLKGSTSLTLVHFPLEVTLRPLSPGLHLPFLPSPQPLSSFLPWG